LTTPGVPFTVGNTPQQAARLVNDEMDHWSAVIKAD
jgi:hypothetical protein